MQFFLDAGQHTVRIVFRDTPVRLWASTTSLLALLLLLLLLLTPWLAKAAGSMGGLSTPPTGHRTPPPGLRLPLGHALPSARTIQPWLSLAPPMQGGAGLARLLAAPLSLATRNWKTLPASHRLFVVLSYTFFAAMLLLILTTFLDYGVAWDEEINRIYGDSVMKWYTSLFHNQSALSYAAVAEMYLYGGFFEIAAHLIGPLLPFGLYEGRHLVTALFGFVGIVYAYKLGVYLSGPIAGFFSALFLALTPVFYGHLFVNPKDIPFATFYLGALYYAIVSYDSLPRLPKSLLFRLALAIGLALGIRVGGVVLLGYLLLLWLAWLGREIVSRDAAARPRLILTIVQLAGSFALVTLLAWSVMLLCWPWAQVSPLMNPIEAAKISAHFVAWRGRVFFEGQTFLATELPPSYLPTWFASTLPEFYFVALLAGFVPAVIRGAKLGLIHHRVDLVLKIGVLVMAVALPPTAAIVLRSVVYDGIRQFLFVVPPVAVLAGVSLAALFSSRAHRIVKRGVGIVVLGAVALTVFDMRQLHPYEYVYFNRAVAGGQRAGAERLETDYWGLSYKEGVDWLINNYRPTADGPVRVANCSKPFLTSYFLDKTEQARRRFMPVPPDGSPNVFLATTRFDCHRLVAGNVLHVVERVGTPLLHVIEVRP